MSASINFTTFTWHNFNKPSHKQLSKIGIDFNLPHEYLKEATPIKPRPKLIKEDRYLFGIILFPWKNQSQKIEKQEIDFFIGENFLITLHENSEPIENFFLQLKKDKDSKINYDCQEALLVSDIFKKAFSNCWPVLDSINHRLDKISELIKRNNTSQEILNDILDLKTEIAEIKRMAEGYEKIVQRILKYGHKFFSDTQNILKFESTMEMAEDVFDNIEIFEKTLIALHQTYEASFAFRSNKLMKIFTLLSAITLPIFLTASILGLKSAPLWLHQNEMFIPETIFMISLVFIIFFFFKKFK